MAIYDDQLLDFMYVDRPKVASLLAQFLSEGLVEQENIEKQTEKSGTTSVGGSLAGIASLLGFSAEHSRSGANSTTETVIRNPEWAQAKALVQYVADATQQTEAGEEAVGLLRILSGKLTIYDLKPFRTVVDNNRLMDAIKSMASHKPGTFSGEIKGIDFAIDALEASRPVNKNTSAINSQIKELNHRRDVALKTFDKQANLAIEGIGQFLRHAPFSTIATLDDPEGSFWFSLKEGALLHDQGDTLLKFGSQIDGTWSVACIIDGISAAPQSSTFPEYDASSNQTISYYLADVFSQMSRLLAGRPAGHRSLMPLVVFRSLGTILK